MVLQKQAGHIVKMRSPLCCAPPGRHARLLDKQRCSGAGTPGSLAVLGELDLVGQGACMGARGVGGNREAFVCCRLPQLTKLISMPALGAHTRLLTDGEGRQQLQGVDASGVAAVQLHAAGIGLQYQGRGATGHSQSGQACHRCCCRCGDALRARGVP